MFSKVKQHWQQLIEGEPGHRFQDRYEERQKQCQGKFDVGKVFNIVVGLIVAVLGLFMIPAPGPGAIIMMVGLGLIGSEFGPLARSLDKAEMKIRPIAEKIQRTALRAWKGSSPIVKVLAGLAVVVCAAGVAYAAFLFVMSNPGHPLWELTQAKSVKEFWTALTLILRGV